MTIQTKNIIKKFDFEKVQKVMKLLKWTWRSPITPSIAEMKETAAFLLDGIVKDKKLTSYSTGGFVAERHKCEQGEEISLSFVIEQSTDYNY